MAIFHGTIKDGKLFLKNRAMWDKYISELPDCKVDVDIKKVRSKRSLSQNNLYWLLLEEISNYTGFYPEELHSSFKAMFLTDKTKKIPLVRSTTRLNKIEFGLYLEKIRIQASELGIELPSPEDYYNQGWLPDSKKN